MAFIPVHDHNKLKYIGFQRTTLALIALNVLVYLWQSTLDGEAAGTAWLAGGVVPAALVGGGAEAAGVLPLPPGWPDLPPALTLLTYMFLHGDVWHLAGNMIFLWVFGDNVEDAMGHLRFLAFYLLCGVAAGVAHAFSEPGSAVPLIGASGATAGIIGAYLMLHPRVRVWIIVLMRIPLRLPAYWILLAWLVLQIVFAWTGADPETAWWSHLGGFAAGVILVVLMRRRGVPLFGRPAAG